MPNSDNGTNSTKLSSKTAYNINYAKNNLKRIPLDVQKSKYEEIQTAAQAVGETVNGYIKKAIDERMERDGGGVFTLSEEKNSTE